MLNFNHSHPFSFKQCFKQVPSKAIWKNLCMNRADPGFSFRGGGHKRLICARTHITSAEPNSLLAGVQGPLKGPGSSRVVLMLSCAIWALFLSILKKKNWMKNIVDPSLGGGGGGGRLLRPPWIRHCEWASSMWIVNYAWCLNLALMWESIVLIYIFLFTSSLLQTRPQSRRVTSASGLGDDQL